MTLIIVLNAVFAAFVVVGIVGLHLYAIAKDHAEHTRSEPARIASSGVAMEYGPQAKRERDRAETYGQVPVPARA
jgi:hypothetical protein